MYIWPVACYIDPQWKKRIGYGWKKLLKEVLKESSSALENSANCTLALLDVITWPIPHFEESILRDQWLIQKEGLQDFYSKCYGHQFDDESLRGIFLLDLARTHLIRFSRTTPYRDVPGPPILHLGFVGSLYWFHLPSKPNLTGGGMASVNIPFAVVNFTKSKKRNVYAAVHEILHLFGAHHHEDGIMDPYGREISSLDDDNKIFVEKIIRTFFENDSPLPGIERLMQQPSKLK